MEFNKMIINVFLNLLDLNVLFAMTVGCIWGIINGAMPGFGASTACALLIPFTFGVDPIIALSMLASVYAGGIYGGSITAITLGVPGTSAAAATIYDGYEMAKKGQSKKALTAAVAASAIGGMFSAVVLLVAAPPLARIGLLFGPAEYFLLAIFGLTVIASLSGTSILKGIMGGLIGLFLGTVGMDPILGEIRFSFGSMYLYDSVPLIPLILGLFAFPRCLLLVKDAFQQGSKTISTDTSTGGGDPINLKELMENWKTLLRSSIIGTIIGIIPAAGTNIACFIGYSEAKRNSKDPSKFGTGITEGVIAAEAANNAVCGGSLVPMLTLGIPGNAVAAVLLGALMIHGLVPGFQLFTKHANITYTFIFAMFFANIIMLIIGWFGGRVYSKIAEIPVSVLAPSMLLISLVGAFVTRQYIFDMGVTLVIGVAAFFLMRGGFPMPTILLGAILGPIAEAGFRRAMNITHGDLTIFFKRPLSIILIILTILSLYAGWRMSKGKGRKNYN
jgi:putative tricarboxylic transport membrane protein